MRRTRTARNSSGPKAKFRNADQSPASPAKVRPLQGVVRDAIKQYPNGDSESDAQTRRYITIFVCALSALFLLAAGLLGLRRNDFAALQNVWSAIAPVLGVVLTYFFSMRRRRK